MTKTLEEMKSTEAHQKVSSAVGASLNHSEGSSHHLRDFGPKSIYPSSREACSGLSAPHLCDGIGMLWTWEIAQKGKVSKSG